MAYRNNTEYNQVVLTYISSYRRSISMTGYRFQNNQRRTLPGLVAVALMAVAATATLSAQTALQPDIVLRPLTPDDVTNYKLPTGTQVSAGLTTIGLGQPAYLEAQVNAAYAAADITGVSWTLTSKPAGSQAT